MNIPWLLCIVCLTRHLKNCHGRWASSTLYLGSRVAQLRKNQQRQSAEGLSMGMVVCAMLANLSYGASILMRANSWYVPVDSIGDRVFPGCFKYLYRDSETEHCLIVS